MGDACTTTNYDTLRLWTNADGVTPFHPLSIGVEGCIRIEAFEGILQRAKALIRVIVELRQSQTSIFEQLCGAGDADEAGNEAIQAVLEIPEKRFRNVDRNVRMNADLPANLADVSMARRGNLDRQPSVRITGNSGQSKGCVLRA